MPTIELIYHTGCPNVEAARRNLDAAMQRLGRPSQWREWNTDAADTPAHAKQFPSPTILVDGREVGEAAGPAGAEACRLGQPPATDQIAEAISKATNAA